MPDKWEPSQLRSGDAGNAAFIRFEWANALFEKTHWRGGVCRRTHIGPRATTVVLLTLGLAKRWWCAFCELHLSIIETYANHIIVKPASPIAEDC
jgi:hypothetical protein